MFVPFESLPENSRVWIYQSEKQLDNSESSYILERIKDFINSWDSHGRELKGSAKLLYKHFLIFSLDESSFLASGCSIDKSVRFIRELEDELNLSLLNRSKQSVLINENIQFFPINEAKQLVHNGILKRETVVFNNVVENKQELESKWQIPASESWLGKFFKNNN